MPLNPPSTAVAASSAIANTAAATKFSNKKTLPANALKAGDIVRIHYQGIATATHTTDTLGLKAFIGATEVAAVAAVDVADNDIFVGFIDVVIRTAGASGTCVAAGFGATGAAGTATGKALYKGSQAIDTTVENDVAIEATWSAADAGNSCRLDVLNVQIIPAAA